MQSSSDTATNPSRQTEETQQATSRSAEESSTSSASQTVTSQKRKRDPNEEEPEAANRRNASKRQSPGAGSQTGGSFLPVNTSSGSNFGSQMEVASTPTLNGANAGEAQSMQALGNMMPHMAGADPNLDPSFTSGAQGQSQQSQDSHQLASAAAGVARAATAGGSHMSSGASQSNPKPQVGTDEWHRLRKDNHKEVERRRRETINEGINELAKIVPGCEKNKGSILQRAVQYITQLKENEATNIEKWTLERLLSEQALSEMSAANDKLKSELERAWREADTWKKACLNAGVNRSDGATGGAPNSKTNEQ